MQQLGTSLGAEVARPSTSAPQVNIVANKKGERKRKVTGSGDKRRKRQ
jgi:hypothetical protein